MPEGPRAAEFRLSADRFDADWYRRDNPDIAGALAQGRLALGHYVASGERDGRSPNPGFRRDWYVARYPKVRQAIADGRLAGAFHDYLLRLAQGVPRRPAPATAFVAASLADADRTTVAQLLRLAARAPGWEFWLIAPPGRLPSAAAGPNLRIVTNEAELPWIDLWIAPDMVPDECSAATLDRSLERLRRRLLADRPVIPAGRRDDGPVHLDLRRVQRLRVTVRAIDRPVVGGGVVLRAAGGIVAEIAPGAGGAATVVDVGGTAALQVTVSGGLAVEFRPAKNRPDAGLDVIVAGGRAAADAWRASLDGILALRPAATLYAVDPPPDLHLPPEAVAVPSMAAALAARSRPALLLPAGVRLFPQAVTHALDLLDGAGRMAIRPAIRHPDGHLESWTPGRLDHDPGHARLWDDARVTLLSADARRAPPRTTRAVAGTALGAIDPREWRARLMPQPARGPHWLHLDCRPDGAAIGRLRLRGAHLTEGGRIVVSGSTGDALAGSCHIRAAARGGPFTEFELPAAADFAWPIDLPIGLIADEVIEIAPAGEWATMHGGSDPRPVLFRLQSVRYQPPATGSTTPSASRRAR